MRGQGADGIGASDAGRGTGDRLAASRRVRLSISEPRAVVVLALLTLAVLASALAGPWTITTSGGSATVPQVSATPMAPMTPSSPPTLDPDTQPGAWDLDLRPLLWVGIMVLIAVVARVARSLLAESGSEVDPGVDEIGSGVDEAGPDPAPDEPSVASLREGLVEAAARLRQGGQASDAVIAAWVALEDAACRSGVRRDVAATPTEFALEVLDRTSADRHATRSLLARYARARFSGLPVTDDDVEGAAADLEVLAATLRAGEHTWTGGDSPTAPGAGDIR